MIVSFVIIINHFHAKGYPDIEIIDNKTYVITSYSIHYTKLYEVGDGFGVGKTSGVASIATSGAGVAGG